MPRWVSVVGRCSGCVLKWEVCGSNPGGEVFCRVLLQREALSLPRWRSQPSRFLLDHPLFGPPFVGSLLFSLLPPSHRGAIFFKDDALEQKAGFRKYTHFLKCSISAGYMVKCKCSLHTNYSIVRGTCTDTTHWCGARI